ncbi:MAG: gliding motility-associated C-terminal domain-containing protein, partial [Bacteroidota bacterium]
LNAFSPDGCWDSAAMQVRVVQLFRIFLPNAFTPGNDQLNESYEPKGTAIGTYTLRVYNRWGQQVFEADPQHPFTGRDRQGRLLPEGVYAVTAIVQSVHGERAFLQTTVHILR